MNPLKDFWEFAKHASSFRQRLVLFAAAAPLVDLLIGIGPPWPNRVAVGLFTAAFEIIIFICAYQFFLPKAVHKLEFRIKLFATMALMIFVIYVALFAFFVHPAPDHWHRVVGGWEHTERVAPHQTDAEAIADNGNDEEKVWTLYSIRIMRMVVLITWLALFSCVSLIFTSFLAIRMKSIKKVKSTET